MNAIEEPPIYKGIGVVIDDCVHDPETKDLIVDLLRQTREADVPCVLYDALPPQAAWTHFTNVAFILLDWELWEKPSAEQITEGVNVGDQLAQEGILANIEFLKQLREICFAPVFIFSHLDPNRIKNSLREAGLFQDQENTAVILVKAKSELCRTAERAGFPLFDAIDSWVHANPAIYILSKWRDASMQAQNALFWDLYRQNPAWPSVLWRAYEKDNDDPEHGLADILLRNMRARLFPLSLDPKIVSPEALPIPDQASLRAVLGQAMIVPGARLPANQYASGDLFQSSDSSYWLNIRCDCDCAPRKGKTPAPIILYLLRAKSCPESMLRSKEYFDKQYGLLSGHHNEGLLFPVDGQLLKVEFKELHQESADNLLSHGAKRIGRITPPHITYIRQRFALYLQREGLPRIPNEAVFPDHEPKEQAIPTDREETVGRLSIITRFFNRLFPPHG
jgi:hypothetical protein